MILVKTDRKGKLAFQCRWSGFRKWVGWGANDTPENRRELEAYAALIDADLTKGIFLREAIHRRMGKSCDGYFPDEEGKVTRGGTIADLYPDFERFMRGTDLRKNTVLARIRYFDKLLIPRFGQLRLEEITPQLLNDLRLDLIERGYEREGGRRKPVPLKEESVKKIINDAFRAFFSWAREDYNFRAYAAGTRPLLDPFEGVRWGRTPKYHPQPFELEEVRRIMSWFEERDAAWFPWVAFLFRTGCRPSEAAGLTIGTVNLGKGEVHFAWSVVGKVRGNTKTREADRKIRLFPDLLEILRRAQKVEAMEPNPDAPFFRDTDGGLVDQDMFSARRWRRALAALKIPPRGLYTTRDTFISHALTAGRPAQAVAEYCGTSLAMLDRHYGRFMGEGGLADFWDSSKEKSAASEKGTGTEDA